MATIASFLGFNLPENSAEDSHDFLPYLKDNCMKPQRTTLIHNTHKDKYAIRDGDWLLINTKSGTDRQPPEAWKTKHKIPAYDGQLVGLYNLRVDLGQRNNLAKHHPDRVTELQALLKKIRDQGHSAPRLSQEVNR